MMKMPQQQNIKFLREVEGKKIMEKTELAKRIYEVSHLNGEFVLRSGQISNEYFDKYLFEAEPNVLKEIALLIKDMIPDGTEVLAGLEMGGIPVVTAISLSSGIKAAFVRKAAKRYGTCKIAEGSDIKGKSVCIVEDVVTTGGQIIESAKEYRAQGANVSYVISVIERSPKGRENLNTEGLELLSLFTMDDLKKHL